MSFQYKAVVIRKRAKPFLKVFSNKEDEVEFEVDGTTYKGSRAESWIEDYGFFDRWFKKVNESYWLIFVEPKEALKKGEVVSPVIPPNIAELTEKKNLFISSSLLWRANKYRGVKPAFRDEYKEPFSFPKIPLWALIPVVLILLVVIGYILLQTGTLDTIIKIFTEGVNQ